MQNRTWAGVEKSREKICVWERKRKGVLFSTTLEVVPLESILYRVLKFYGLQYLFSDALYPFEPGSPNVPPTDIHYKRAVSLSLSLFL